MSELDDMRSQEPGEIDLEIDEKGMKRDTWHQLSDTTWKCERTGEVRQSWSKPSDPEIEMYITADEILKTAASLVSGDRAKQHGDKLVNLNNVSHLWNALLGVKGSAEGLDAHDVATMMELLKIARRYTGTYNPDDYIDAAGYAAIAGELKDGENR